MTQTLALIPKPQVMTVKQAVFPLRSDAVITYPPGGENAARLLQKLTGLAFAKDKGSIRLEFEATIQGEEAYQLDVDESGICIAASTAAGLFYGAQTLRQLLPVELEVGTATFPCDIPYLHIEDAPRFTYRGFMLDVSRHFFGPQEIKRLIDLLALQKINRFHWHLTDDQGWRIEIKKYPRLAEVGGFRKESQVGGFLLSNAIFDGKPHGGFYTQDEVREIVTYAKANFIEVIPEIDSPGHAVAAMAAYPELSCSGEPMEVRTSIGAFSRPLCAGKESVYEFLEDVFGEIVGLFPYKTIHIGGDEVNKKEWKKCPHCQRRKREFGLKTENDLQMYFENRIAKILKEKGCRGIGWNEVMHDDLDSDLINQFWFYFRKKETIKQLKKGRKTIVSDFGNLYLDYPYRVTELVKTYNFEPYFFEVTDAEAQAILGVEGALWSEYVDTRERIEWQMFPRFLAISEMAWTSRSGRNYDDFLARLEHFEKRLDVLGVHHATRACYMKYPDISKIPQFLRILLSREHPALVEYQEYHPSYRLKE